MSESKKMVSVCMITYNHEKYISQAIEGVLMQEAFFNIELIIADDCSTDKTLQICRYYQKKHPDIVRIINRKANLGVIPNFIDCLKASTGKYIALCEGDDYWIDPLKIQKQVLFLEANQEYSLIHSNGFRNRNNKLTPWNEWDILDGEVSKSFYYGNIVRTCSALFRRNFLDEYLQLISECKSNIIGDWPLFAYYSTKGDFGYLKERMCVYRYNPSSVTSTRSKDNLMKYVLDVVEVKRFLRDVLFKGKLDDVFSESILNADRDYAKLKNAFDTYRYSLAKNLITNIQLSHRFTNLAKYVNNRQLFYLACFIRKIRQTINSKQWFHFIS